MVITLSNKNVNQSNLGPGQNTDVDNDQQTQVQTTDNRQDIQRGNSENDLFFN